MSATTEQVQAFCKVSAIPEGYGCAIGPDNKKYIAPLYMIADLEHNFDAYQRKLAVGVEQASPLAQLTRDSNPISQVLGEGYATYPPSPTMSKQECLSLHADVLALQNRLGLSYKDAAHRLYMAEVSKAKTSYESLQALIKISDGIDETMTHFEAHCKEQSQIWSDAEHRSPAEGEREKAIKI